MSISAKLATYLERLGLNYELLEHPYSNTSMMTAQLAHIHGDQLAKGVILEDEDGYLMAVVPSTHRLQLGVLHNMMVPAAGDAYGMQMIVDDSLSAQEDVYFEAGDHSALVHMRGADFRTLMAHAEHGRFSQHT